MRPHIFVVLHVAGFMSSLSACALGCGEKSHVETSDLVSGGMGANSTSASGADSDSDSVALSSATAATPSNPGDGGDGMSADDDPSDSCFALMLPSIRRNSGTEGGWGWGWAGISP